MKESSPDFRRTGSTILCAVIALILLIFLPLLLSLAEYEIFGTHKVEDFFKQIGLSDALTKIYLPIINLFQR